MTPGMPQLGAEIFQSREDFGAQLVSGPSSGLRRRLGCFLRPLAGLLGGVQLSCSSVMSATWASRCASAASALTVAATPCSPAPREVVRSRSPLSEASAVHGHDVADPTGHIVARSYEISS